MDTIKTSSKKGSQLRIEGSGPQAISSGIERTPSSFPRASDDVDYDLTLEQFEQFLKERKVERRDRDSKAKGTVRLGDANDEEKGISSVGIGSLMKDGNLADARFEYEKKVVLKIKSADELSKLKQFIEGDSDKKRLSKIVCLDLEKIEIDEENISIFNEFLMEFFEKIEYFSECKTLKLGNIRQIVKFEFPNNSKKIENLSFGNIYEVPELDLKEMTGDLKSIFIKNIYSNVTLSLPRKLTELVNVVIENVENEITFELVNESSFVNAFFNNVMDWAVLRLEKVRNLSRFVVKRAGDDVSAYLGSEDERKTSKIETCTAKIYYS